MLFSQVEELSDEDKRKQLERKIDGLIARCAGAGRTHMDYKDFVVLLGLDTKATGRWVFKKSVEVKKADLAKVSFCLRYTHRGRQQRRPGQAAPLATRQRANRSALAP